MPSSRDMELYLASFLTVGKTPRTVGLREASIIAGTRGDTGCQAAMGLGQAEPTRLMRRPHAATGLQHDLLSWVSIMGVPGHAALPSLGCRSSCRAICGT